MPRKNLDNGYLGESQRVTVRLSRKEHDALTELAASWPGDRSELIRRALREAVPSTRRQRRESIEAVLPTLSLIELRKLAAQWRVRGRSRMNKAELADAMRATLHYYALPLT